MSQDSNPLPQPESHWIALGIVVAALAIALGRKRRAVFFQALRRITSEHEARERIAVFGQAKGNGRTMSNAIRGGVSWLSRLIVELDDGDGQ